MNSVGWLAFDDDDDDDDDHRLADCEVVIFCYGGGGLSTAVDLDLVIEG